MKIIIATGGTGGHLFPSLKVADELRKMGHEIYFLGSFGIGVEKMRQSGFPFENLHARGIQFSHIGNGIRAVLSILRACARSFCFLRRWRPDLVVGFGGYGAFPVVWAAVILRCPTMIHEQNVVPGRANALLACFVNKVAVSFKESFPYVRGDKMVLTGCPCHVTKKEEDRAEVLKAFRLKEDRPTLLVFGGSQGSQRVNREVVQAVGLLKKELDFQVIHATGKNDYARMEQAYKELGITVALFEFLDKIDLAYSVADVVISRAGAVTVSEIALFQRPAILIPYPYAGGHQIENARVLSAAGVADVIEEKDLSPERLKNSIVKWLKSRGDLARIQQRLGDISIPDAAERLAREAVLLAS